VIFVAGEELRRNKNMAKPVAAISARGRKTESQLKKKNNVIM